MAKGEEKMYLKYACMQVEAIAFTIFKHGIYTSAIISKVMRAYKITKTGTLLSHHITLAHHMILKVRVRYLPLQSIFSRILYPFFDSIASTFTL